MSITKPTAMSEVIAAVTAMNAAETRLGGGITVVDSEGRRVMASQSEESIANQSLASEQAIVEGLIYPGTVGMIVAPPKAGKTNLVSMLTHEIARGRDYLGYHVCRAANILFYEYEESPIAQQMRLQRFPDEKADFIDDMGHMTVYNPAPASIVVDAAGASHVEPGTGLGLQLIAYLTHLPPELAARPTVVVVDTLARAVTQVGGSGYGADLRAVGALGEFARALDREMGAKVAFLLVHHTNKGEHIDAMDAISGTQGIAGSVDWWLRLSRSTDKETGERGREGVLIGSSRLAADGDVRRFVRLSDQGFWELDTERETEEELRRRTGGKEAPAWLAKVVSFVREVGEWKGTATEFIAAAGLGDLEPRHVGNVLNAPAYSAWLAAQGVGYENKRSSKKRMQHLWLLGEEKPAEAVADDLIAAASSAADAWGAETAMAGE